MIGTCHRIVCVSRARLRTPLLGVLTAAIAVSAVLVASAAQQTASTVGVDGRENAFVSAAAHGETVALSRAASDSGRTDIYAALSRDGGKHFSPPVRVNDVPGDARVGGEQPPRVALVPRQGRVPDVVVVWTAPGERGTRLVSARSADGARTFAPASVVPGSDASGNRGWQSTAVNADGRVVALWLDHRGTAASTASAHRHGTGSDAPAADDQVARARQSRLLFSALDGAEAQTITSGVCYCCSTALVSDGQGGIYAAWRHVFEGNERDIAFVHSSDGGRTFPAPVRVSADRWQFNGCPENGPSIAIDGQQRVHVVWPTLVTDDGRSNLALFHAMTAKGRRFGTRVQIPTTGTPSHPQAATAGDGTLVLAWDEALGGGRRRIQVASAAIDSSGQATFAPVALGVPGEGTYPAIAGLPDGALVAWTRRTSSGSVIALVRISS